MAFDPDPWASVARHLRVATLAAALAGVTGCGPAVRPEAPGEEPTPPRVVKRPAPPPGRQALLGEMCPQAAAGRPGLSPLAVRTVSWSSERTDMLTPLQRGAAAQFTVLALDGRKAGQFAAIGTAETDGIEVAVGSYAGAAPCARTGKDAVADPTCLRVQKGCGLAVATIGAAGGVFAGEDAEAPALVTGGACAAGDALAIDIDADGTPEVFPQAAFVDPVRAPAEEVTAVAQVAPACTASFALYGLTPALQGVGLEARHKVELDVLGVVDVDGDGRREVVVAFRYPERRTIATYSAIESAARLELVGESAPWP